MSLLPTSPAAPVHVDLTIDDALQDQLRRLVRDELSEGETIEWFGQPDPASMALKSMSPVFFGVPWTAFSIFWMYGASHGSAIFALFGVPFVLIGLGMLASPLWAMRDASRTAYVITNRRAIVISCSTASFSGLAVRSFTPDRLQDLERRERPDRSGDLILERRALDSETSDGRAEAGFFSIPDVKQVERQLRRLVERGR